MPAFNKILIANRGEIACRVISTARNLGYRTVAVFSAADSDARHVQMADEAVCIGAPTVQQSYLNIDVILDAARRSGADAIHPGYGFLSENAEFARACAAANLVFIGPSAEAIELMGSKRLSKLAMLKAGVPCIDGYQGAEQDDVTLSREAERIGYPLMIKASAGGGGRGMRLVEHPDQLLERINTARSEAQNAFGSGELILEQALINPRHVEMQIFGDSHGNLVYLGERDCSVQRRHQKVIEEAPCPVVDAGLREAMGAAALQAGRAVSYLGAGTVEFLLASDGQFYFLEMNTRLQVEHPVTEMITGLDLVAWQIKVASGEALPLQQEQIQLNGHAIEARLYAEDPAQGFLPQTGRVLRWQPLLFDGIRVDHGLSEDQTVSPFYDPMLGKIIAHGATREEARRKLLRAIQGCVLLGVNTNQRLLTSILKHPAFIDSHVDTGFIAQHLHNDPCLRPATARASQLAVAAALFYQGSASSHPSKLAGWSNTGPEQRRYLLGLGEQVHEVELTRNGARLDLKVQNTLISVHVLSYDARSAWVEVDGVRSQQACYLLGKHLWLHDDSGALQLTDRTHDAVAGPNVTRSGTIRAPMDGSIVDVLVSEGATVSQGQLLMVLEAMKMEHPLNAAIDGVIRQIQVVPGDQVKGRQVLLEVAPMDGSG
ncbi:acetyl/propionyl/methylcrotonyl-CoA carboxylase subunit alpha [Pseudomonas viridiflava]|uniref:acetyl/propionyl/methylcrotonyl-CoA carboxylase subunit alpha n=1 Tax=Pseudomonas viridiflava TaxID=33069 RepID=UPI000F06CA18|nr:acetyl/propionyl/methylcrotonyl-CoA carboxylase subunit alpha [Pseudomonas viridiflava]